MTDHAPLGEPMPPLSPAEIAALPKNLRQTAALVAERDRLIRERQRANDLLSTAKDAIHDLCLGRDDDEEFKAIWVDIRDHLGRTPHA